MNIQLKVKTGVQQYFIGNPKRLKKLNQSFFSHPRLAGIGLVKENKKIWFMRTKKKEGGDTIWVEINAAEAREYRKSLKLNLKEEITVA